MWRYFIYICINTINIGLTLKLNHYHSYQVNKLFNLKTNFILYAKKKTNKLISDELWTSLEPEDEDKTSSQVISKVPTVSSSSIDDLNDNNNSNVKSKTKKQSKQLISNDLLSYLIEEVDETKTKVVEDTQTSTVLSSSSSVVVDKKKKKDKNKNKEEVNKDNYDDNNDKDTFDVDEQSSSMAVDTAVVIDEKDLTLEQKIRKEKPSARVRFIESSQPDFVSIGLEDVGLMYGNDVILKSATFSISTGMIVDNNGNDDSNDV